MITVTKQENGVLFTFQDSNKYLYGSGTIEVPFNSLSIIMDESDMITLRKSASNDIFLSARYDTDLGYGSKEEAVEALKGMLFAETGGGGSESGITSGEVQTMIDESISGKADTSAVTAVASDVQTVSGQVATKVATSDFNTYSAATATALGNKQDALQYYSEDTTVNTATIHIENTDDGTVGEVYLDGASVDISALRTEEDKDNGSMVETHSDINGNSAGVALAYEKNIDDAEATHSYLNVQEGLIAMEVMANEETTNVDVTSTGVTINGDAVATESYVDDATSGKVDTSAITTAITSGSTDSEIPTAKAVYDATQSGGGGMDDDTQQLISTAFNDLNDRKADLTELSKYQKKGDYVKTSTLSDYMTNDAFDEYATAKERIISGALNDLNDKFGGLRLVKISQTDYDNLATKDENTLYIINNVI